MDAMNENRLAAARRVVIKIGSSLLTEVDDGSLREDWLAALAEDIAAWRSRHREVVVVSSGAIAVGRRALGITGATLKLEEKQACAAVGQIRLAHAYQAALDRHGITVAQVLLTLEDSEHRRRYLNARSTIDQLLGMNALPLINENDTVATAEIRFGDNDRLAARVAQMASADVLVLLSDIDGLYTADPAHDTGAERLEEITAITPEIEAMAGGSRNYEGSGGMITKLAAARITTGAGCHMVITKGAANHCLRDLEQGAACTWFVAAGEPRTARKHWIAGTLQPQGALVVDDGAARALARGRSLLPAGVAVAEGRFERGDLVLVRDHKGRELGRGLCAYGSEDAARIAGHKSREIEYILGYRGREEMIHRDDLVLVLDTSGENR